MCRSIVARYKSFILQNIFWGVYKIKSVNLINHDDVEARCCQSGIPQLIHVLVNQKSTHPNPLRVHPPPPPPTTASVLREIENILGKLSREKNTTVDRLAFRGFEGVN